MGRGPVGAGNVDEPLRVGRVRRADDEQQVDLAQQLLHGPLSVGGRVADVLPRRALDPGEAAAQHGDDLARLVDRERRLGEVCERSVGRKRDALGVLRRLDEDDRVGRLAERALHLLVPRVSDEDQCIAGCGVAARLRVHLRHQRAGGVDRRQAQLFRLAADCRGDAVSREDDGRAVRNVRERVDEDRAARAQVLHHVRVVDDLLADVDRAPVERERSLNRLDRPFDSRAVASR